MKNRGHRYICLACLIVLWILQGIVPALAQETEPTLEPTSADETQIFPRGKIFLPLIADPKQVMFRANLYGVSSDIDDALTGSIAAGESIGLIRIPLFGGDAALQFDLAGGVFAQFDVLAKSSDLINADYVVGLPLAFRAGAFSMRLRYYHQSSHLGDEFLLNFKPPLTRLNFSYESFEGLISFDIAALRLYGGGEILLRRDPDTIDPLQYHIGAEYRRPKPLFHFNRDGIGTLLLTSDIKFWEENSFVPSTSVKGGVELGSNDDPAIEGRRLRFLLEGYYGLSPYGQFFAQDADVLALGGGIQINL